MRRNRKSDYLILALACLVFLNIGAIVIKGKSNIKIPTAANKMRQEVLGNFKLYLGEKIDELSSIRKIVSVFKKQENGNENYPEKLEPEDTKDNLQEGLKHEGSREDDIIIESLDEYESLIIIRDSKGGSGVENIPEPIGINKFKVNKDNPYILIYHTHATEAYLNDKQSNYRSSKKEDNVLGIGDIMSTILSANENKVDHDETYHDLPSYTKSYSRSLNTIREKTEKNNNLKVFLDIHRDAIDDTSPNIEKSKKYSQLEINGKMVSKFSLVVGPDSENKDQVLAFAKYIKAVSDTLYPGLCRGIIIKPRGKYNQHLSDYSALIEMGYNFNDIETVRESSKLVGEVLSYAIKGLIE